MLAALVLLQAVLACNKSEPQPAPAAKVEAKVEATEEPSAPAEPAAPAHAEHAHAAPPSVELPPVPAGAKVSFAEPADGAQVSGAATDGKVAVPVKMAAEGITVEPAGEVKAGSGHHHILIGGEPMAAGSVVPKDEKNLHFGGGQTETTLQLEPGEHTLVMQFADGIHRSYGPALSAAIKITVKAE